MEHVRWEERPRLHRPVLIAAFEGWNDAADAATGAARYLRDRWSARPFASIDPEEFFDFSVTRPHIHLEDGLTRRVDWPQNELAAAALPGTSRDVVILVGTEPQLRWRTFAAQVVGLVAELNVELIITMGALLADVPHSRPVRITSTAADLDLIEKLGLSPSTYEGPTGIVGVVHEALARAQVPSASLWAAVPHYVAATPSPKASLALVRRATDLLATPLSTTDLEIMAADYERQVSEVVASDDDVSTYVSRLEATADAEDSPLEFRSGDSLAADFEKFLREQPND